jgi:hypothetical protein
MKIQFYCGYIEDVVCDLLFSKVQNELIKRPKLLMI